MLVGEVAEDAEEEEGLEEEDEGGESDQDRVVARKPSKSRSWTAQEDQLVRDLVKEHGLRKWAFIASCLEGKTQKQVYARWRDYLQPGISCQPWSKQEQVREGTNARRVCWRARAATRFGVCERTERESAAEFGGDGRILILHLRSVCSRVRW